MGPARNVCKLRRYPQEPKSLQAPPLPTRTAIKEITKHLNQFSESIDKHKQKVKYLLCSLSPLHILPASITPPIHLPNTHSPLQLQSTHSICYI